MPSFSRRSNARLSTVHVDLQDLFHEVIKYKDCTILCGHRGKKEQTQAFRTGMSKAMWGQSAHNLNPSMAVDVAPYPINWDNIDRFYRFAGFVEAVAVSLDINVRWGGDFKTLVDMPHWELRSWKN